MKNTSELIEQLKKGNLKALARCITLVENKLEGNSEILKKLEFRKNTPVVGITGPPGAGKSTLLNSIISSLTAENKKVGLVLVDPTSPFNYGSLLGDRLRMSEHFNNENVYIRSIATRGSLGGLSAAIIEITDVMRSADFDYIFIETVGVGQSEIEIVGLADTTVLVLVPEAGDEVQTLKSGVMEIADIFVVNKSDRAGSNNFLKNLHQLVHSKPLSDWDIPVIAATATQNEGTGKVIESIKAHQPISNNTKKAYLLAEKAYHMIQNNKMQSVSKQKLFDRISKIYQEPDFNLYRFVDEVIK